MRNFALKAYTWANARQSREEGQTVVEYALVVGAVSIVLIVVLGTFGSNVIGAMQTEVTQFIATLA